jgi:hypothetical protein
MIKRTAAALAVILSVACASTPMTSSTESAGGALKSTTLRDAPDYILLSSPTQVRAYDFSNGVRGLHVRGTLTSAGFVPAGEIQGSGKMCADGKDWLSLRDMTVHKGGDSASPAAPYIMGCATSSGFQPASRQIVAQ